MTITLIPNSPIIFPQEANKKQAHGNKRSHQSISSGSQVAFPVVADLMLEEEVSMVTVTDVAPMVKESVMDTKGDI